MVFQKNDRCFQKKSSIVSFILEESKISKETLSETYLNPESENIFIYLVYYSFMINIWSSFSPFIIAGHCPPTWTS